ncbi:MAG: bacillithiol biosynthesis deacetylase BshB1 [Bacteroidia bacterium]|nr:bacillithiol biosynthesis deacetylase BshB1 [Bacteroidia bacterium]NNM22824.1 bacillithiol biosynthesis deacetylase BshB1 [Flavobacteriaceae bacterium]
MKLDILAVGAHPDDVEMSCGATLAKEIDAGKKVGILDLTQGELGTRGNAELRLEEAKAAAEILGVSIRENLGLADAFFENNQESQLAVIKVLRTYRPEIVFCNAVVDRHIDHGKGSKLVSDACFISGLRKVKTFVEGEEQEAWRPKRVYHYIQWEEIEPDFVVDVTGYMEKKMEAIYAYKSQFYDPKNNEPDTPISSKNTLDSLTYRNRNFGRLIGTEAGEGFTVERYAAVQSVFDLI